MNRKVKSIKPELRSIWHICSPTKIAFYKREGELEIFFLKANASRPFLYIDSVYFQFQALFLSFLIFYSFIMGASISRRSRNRSPRSKRSPDQRSTCSHSSVSASVKGTTIQGRVYHDVESSVCKFPN
jgi:hypothetical protein